MQFFGQCYYKVALIVVFCLGGGIALADDSACDVACLRLAYARPSHEWLPPTIDKSVSDWQELSPLPIAKLGDERIIALGKSLFFDKKLSADNRIACADCHKPEFGFADNRRVSVGVFEQVGTRNALSLLHFGQLPSRFFWDGRVNELGQAVINPIENPSEMAMPLTELPKKLSQDYGKAFYQVFGQQLDERLIGIVLGAYVQSLSVERTAFDEFLDGNVNALTDKQLQGLHLFRTKGRCMNCHFGAMMTDNRLHNLNQMLAGRAWQDFGAYELTHNLDDVGKFKTPSLRNLSKTKPWFHHGLFVNLRGIVAIYNGGMPLATPPNAPDISRYSQLDPLIQPLNLTADEQDALTEFLLTL